MLVSGSVMATVSPLAQTHGHNSGVNHSSDEEQVSSERFQQITLDSGLGTHTFSLKHCRI